MCDDSYMDEKAIGYFKEIISKRDIPISFPYLQVQIEHTCPKEIQQWMNQKYAGEELFDFFDKHSDVFSVSKLGIVSVGPSKIKKISKKRDIQKENDLKQYFENYLRKVPQPVSASALYTYLQNHPTVKTDNATEYLNMMYPGDTFELFFCRFPDTFEMSSNSGISLRKDNRQNNPVFENYVRPVQDDSNCEEDAVDFYQNILMTRYSGPVNFKNLVGHLGQAPDSVRIFMNENYPRDDILSFFQDNSQAFQVDWEGNVSSQTVEDTHTYFLNILQNVYWAPVHFTKLQKRLQDAPPNVQYFLNTVYSRRIQDFFRQYSDTYEVSENGKVSLKDNNGIDECCCVM